MFPKSTEFNKRIPKTKFYEHIELGRKIKDSFVQDIDSIIWANKIAPSTVNIAAGEKVTEIQVFRIILKQSDFNKDVLKTIDEQIPYHILFIVCYRDKEQAWIGYKEQSGSESRAFKVDSYYHTAWQKPEEMELAIEGLNMDAVYESFVKQISASTITILLVNCQEHKDILQEEIQCCCPPTIYLQPCNNYTQKEAKQLIPKLQKAFIQS